MTRLFLRFFYHLRIGLMVALSINVFLALAPTAHSDDLNNVTIISGNKQHTFSVEIMRTSEERARGLMHVKSMPKDRGMLFDFGDKVIARMWMKNTFIPLDMVFARENGTITNIAKNTVPHSLEILSSTERVRYVLEINGGMSTTLGIEPGDRMIIPAP